MNRLRRAGVLLVSSLLKWTIPKAHYRRAMLLSAIKSSISRAQSTATATSASLAMCAKAAEL